MRRLREFSVVVISPPADSTVRSGSFECHVLAIVGGTAALEPLVATEVMWLPDRLDHVLLCFEDERGLVGLRGTLVQGQSIADLRFVVTDGTQLGRRAASRIRLCAPITLRSERWGEDEEALTADLSADGILVSCERPAPVGDVLSFSLSLPGSDDCVSATATVVRQADGMLAMQIDRRDRATRVTLGRFVLEHNRAALRSRHVATLELEF